MLLCAALPFLWQRQMYPFMNYDMFRSDSTNSAHQYFLEFWGKRPERPEFERLAQWEPFFFPFHNERMYNLMARRKVPLAFRDLAATRTQLLPLLAAQLRFYEKYTRGLRKCASLPENCPRYERVRFHLARFVPDVAKGLRVTKDPMPFGEVTLDGYHGNTTH